VGLNSSKLGHQSKKTLNETRTAMPGTSKVTTKGGDQIGTALEVPDPGRVSYRRLTIQCTGVLGAEQRPGTAFNLCAVLANDERLVGCRLLVGEKRGGIPSMGFISSRVETGVILRGCSP
jgi:hypothetical protein